MNFFGVEISDAQFEAALAAARAPAKGGQKVMDEAVREALGFEAGSVAAPPAGVLSRES